MPAIGQDTLTSIARRYILPQVTDNVYLKNNALLYRLIRSNKRQIQGGTQIEVPLMYKKFSTGGSYRGFDTLTVAPQDTVKNGYVDWKQYYVTFAVDGLSLIKTDSPLAIANLLELNGQQMYMEMGELLGAGIFNDGVTDPKGMNGLGAIMSASNTYAGINRTVDTWWQATIDASSQALSHAVMHSIYAQATLGGTHPTIWFGNGTNYNRLYALSLPTANGYNITYGRQPGGSDEVLAQAGFTNLLFENVPFVRDDNMVNGHVYALNENFLSLVVSPRADFFLTDFEKPVNQDAFISTLLWAGNMICMNSKTQAGLTGLTG
ncbi:MAG: phage major capsid protein [Dehalococcoidia bacterium]|nr:phage major capsid protein [Dehalococcoidia bacterium]